jgi:PAS domain S-box-containing protein
MIVLQGERTRQAHPTPDAVLLPEEFWDPRLAIHAAGVGFCVLDTNATLLTINAEAERLLGLAAAEHVGLPFTAVVDDEAGECSTLNHVLLRSRIQAGISLRNEFGRMLRADGTVFPAYWVLQPITPDGVVVGATLAFLDMTRVRELQEEQEYQLREALLLNRVIAAAASTRDPSVVLAKICEELAQALDLPQAAFALLNVDASALTVVAEYRAPGRPSALDMCIPIAGNPNTQYVLEHRVPLVVANAQSDPRQQVIRGLHEQRGTISLLIVPLVLHDRVAGNAWPGRVGGPRFHRTRDRHGAARCPGRQPGA